MSEKQKLVKRIFRRQTQLERSHLRILLAVCIARFSQHWYQFLGKFQPIIELSCKINDKYVYLIAFYLQN